MIKNWPEDIKIKDDKFLGIYRGVVESNQDSEKAGRCRIRVWGLHTSKKTQEDTEGIPTEHLPWAEPVQSITEGSICGFGMWSVPLQGSHVFVFFENGNYLQPRYFASAPGIQPSIVPDNTRGFSDPDGNYPTSHRLNEPDLHRLARGVSEGTVVEYIENNLDTGVSTALGGSWNQPTPSYASVYPHNMVIATHGGIVMELDSTPNNQRFHIYHPSYTYIEITPDGDFIVRNNKDKFEIVLQNKNAHIQQNRNLTIDQSSKYKVGVDVDEEIGNDQTTEIGHNEDLTVGNDRTTEIGNDQSVTIGNDEDRDTGGNLTESIGSNWTLSVNGNVLWSIGGTFGIESGTGGGGAGDQTWTINGDLDITATGNITINANRIDLNP